MEPPTVLYVDADDDTRSDIADDIATDDLLVRTADSVAAATDLLADRSVDCLVSDYQLPDGTAFDLVAEARDRSPGIGAILYTDADLETIDADRPETDLTEYLPRDVPDARDQLRTLIHTTVGRHAQSPYPLREDEPDRQSAIDALDIDAEVLDEPFDRLARLAAQHFQVEVASINVIEDRVQRIRTCYGADWAPTAREDSICTYTILADDEVMAVEDTTDDPRFANNDELQRLGIRAYMGANVTTPAGHPVATLCVYDDQPRRFSDAERAYLQELAALGGDLLAGHLDADGGHSLEGTG